MLRAQMNPRHELKFFLNEGDALALARRLDAVLWRDAHGDENNEYMIRSLYFDDAYDSAYYDKVAGVMQRDKYRLRIYGYRDTEIFLERKRKLGDLIQKSSVRVTRRLAEQLMDGDPTGLQNMKNPLLRDVYREMRTRLLRPKVIVDYAREAYRHPAENVRVTFDKRLRTGLASLDFFNADIATVSPLGDATAILEVKYDGFLPDHVSALLAGTPAERSAISKYALCRRFEPL